MLALHERLPRTVWSTAGTLTSPARVADACDASAIGDRMTRGSAAVGEVISVALTRTDLVALKETIELTPVFEGRAQAREAIREVLRERRPSPLWIEASILEAVARRIVPIDVPTASLRSKLDRTLQDEHAQESRAVQEAEDGPPGNGGVRHCADDRRLAAGPTNI